MNRVGKGEKVVVCGRAVMWRDDEIKEKMQQRRESNLGGMNKLREEYILYRGRSP